MSSHEKKRPTAPAAEAALLLAIVTCPALLIPFADHPFEPHKAGFLWAATAATWVALAGAAPVWRPQLRAFRRGWLGVLLVCTAIGIIAMLVSTAWSASPALAWWGSALRRHGALTEISILLVLIAAIVIGTDEVLDRLLTATLVGSIGPTVYALFQVAGVDPVSWDAGVSTRGSSTFGNPLFLAGYLVTVWPLTLGRALADTRRRHMDGASGVRAISAWILLALQSAALIGARSRGPALALVTAMSLAALVMVAVRNRRAGRFLAGLAAVAAVLFLFMAPPRMHLLAIRAPLDDAAPRMETTGAIRVVLWDAAAKSIQAMPNRLAFGTGPESTKALISEHLGSEVQELEGPDVSADRAHNETIETLAGFGVVGLLVRLAIIGVVLVAALAGVGLLDPSSAGAFAIGAVVALLSAAAVATWSGRGLWAIAVAPPVAAALAISGWILWRRSSPRPYRADVTIAIVAATAAWFAHYVEIQLGVATIASSLNGAIAMAMVVGRARLAADDDVAVPEPRSTAHADRAGQAIPVLAGWSIAVLTVGLAGPRSEAGASVWLIAASAWLLSLGVVRGNAGAALKSAVAWVAVAVAWLVGPGLPGAARDARTAAFVLVDRLPLFYVAAAACLAAIGWWLTPVANRWRQWPTSTAWALAAGAAAAVFSVRLTSADVLAHSAAERAHRRDPGSAVALYREALARDPSNDGAQTQLADTLMTQADSTQDTGSRNALLAGAGDALARARAADPFDYHHPRNLAALQRRWARRLPRPERGPHLEEADRLYQSAAALAPANGGLWAEWANLEAERGRSTEAYARLERAASLNAAIAAGSVADALLLAEGAHLDETAALSRVGLDLKRRGYPALAALYAAKAAAHSRPPR